ncbi:MAG: NfeD family protein [Methylotenera sp.]|nr:NfeD family protein [Methylotenera sp.]
MIEAMWLWGAVGLILLAAEMATGTFYILWFGVAALCVAIAMWLFPSMPVAYQFAIYAALSLGSLAIWRRYYKNTSTDSRVGQSQGEEIGRVGTVIETVSLKQNGKIRFAQGLMGSREWDAISEETIEAGSDATVVAVVGNALKISTK